MSHIFRCIIWVAMLLAIICVNAQPIKFYKISKDRNHSEQVYFSTDGILKEFGWEEICISDHSGMITIKKNEMDFNKSWSGIKLQVSPGKEIMISNTYCKQIASLKSIFQELIEYPFWKFWNNHGSQTQFAQKILKYKNQPRKMACYWTLLKNKTYGQIDNYLKEIEKFEFTVPEDARDLNFFIDSINSLLVAIYKKDCELVLQIYQLDPKLFRGLPGALIRLSV